MPLFGVIIVRMRKMVTRVTPNTDPFYAVHYMEIHNTHSLMLKHKLCLKGNQLRVFRT